MPTELERQIANFEQDLSIPTSNYAHIKQELTNAYAAGMISEPGAFVSNTGEFIFIIAPPLGTTLDAGGMDSLLDQIVAQTSASSRRGIGKSYFSQAGDFRTYSEISFEDANRRGLISNTVVKVCPDARLAEIFMRYRIGIINRTSVGDANLDELSSLVPMPFFQDPDAFVQHMEALLQIGQLPPQP